MIDVHFFLVFALQIIIVVEIKCTEYLSWQSADNIEPSQIPRPVGDVLPAWWRQMPGNVSHAREHNLDHRQILTDHGNRSARFCLGLRGAHNLGWTIPLETSLDLTFHGRRQKPATPSLDSDAQSPTIWQPIEQMQGHPVYNNVPEFRPFVHIMHLHPAMLEGSVWSQQVDGLYQWGVALVSWPWRAVLPQGWRLLIMAHPLEWSHDWHVFTGCVDGNYLHHVGSQGGHWKWPHAMQDNLCYFKVETVIAYRLPYVSIPMDTCLFSAVPVWDPEYKPKTFRPHPSFLN